MSRIRTARRPQDGFAMIVSMMAMVVVTSLAVVAMTVALHNDNGSAVDRKRTQAVAAAEAGINYAFQQLAANNLISTYSGTLPTAPNNASFSVTATCYTSYPPSGSSVACTTPGVAAVELKSTGTTAYNGYGSRLMTALVRLSPISTSSFGDAFYSAGALTASNGFTVNGQNGNVYTNGDSSCTNGQSISGWMHVFGTVNWSNNCSVTGELKASGNVTKICNNCSTGPLYSTGGSISGVSGTVNGNEYAAGTIASGGTVHGTAYPNQTGLVFPTESFPSVFDGSSLSNWFPSSSFTTDSYSNCSTADTFLQSSAPSLTTPQLVRMTGCAWAPNGTYQYKTDIAIVVDGGVNTSHAFTFQNTDSVKHTIYIIVPSSNPTPTCGASNGDFKTTQTINFDANTTTFVYTPCNLSMTQTSSFNGQLYVGGTSTITQPFTENYSGATFPGSATSGQSNNVDIAYIREQSS